MDQASRDKQAREANALLRRVLNTFLSKEYGESKQAAKKQPRKRNKQAVKRLQARKGVSKC